MTDDPSRQTAGAVLMTVPAVLEEISGVRRTLARAVVEAGDDRSVAHDIALAASELCTNVVQYASTDTYTVSCERRDGRWILEVSHAEGVDLARSESVPPTAQSGRGLLIVRSLMDTVEVVQADAGPAIRCTLAAA